MIAPQRRSRSYPVLLPREARSPAAAPRPRRGRTPVGGAALAVVVLAALLGHVGLQASVAKAGVRLRELRAEIAQLERDRARLDAQTASLRAPARIERIAVARLGMRPPNSAQLAAVPVRLTTRAAVAARPDWFDRVRGWLGVSAATAQEQAP